MSSANFEKIAEQLAVRAVKQNRDMVKQAEGWMDSVSKYINTPNGKYMLGGLGGAGLGALVGSMQPKRKGRNALYYGALGGLGGLGLAHLMNSAGQKQETPAPAQKTQPSATTANAKPAEPKFEEVRPTGGRRPPGAQPATIRTPQQPAPIAPENQTAEFVDPKYSNPETATTGAQDASADASAPKFIPQEMYDLLPQSLKDKATAELMATDPNAPGGTAMRQAYSFPGNSPEYVAAQLLTQKTPDGKYVARNLSDILPEYASRFEPGTTKSMFRIPDSVSWPTAEDTYFQTARPVGMQRLYGQEAMRAKLQQRVVDAVRAAAVDPDRTSLPNFGFSLDAARTPMTRGGGGSSAMYRSLRDAKVLPPAAGEHFVNSGFNVNDSGTVALINKLRQSYARDPETGALTSAYDAAVKSGITTPEQLSEFLRSIGDPGRDTVNAWTNPGGRSGEF